MNDRLTLATGSGLPLLTLAFHVGAGLVAIAAGFTAITVRKGGVWHRRSGLIFVYSMIATGLLATAVYFLEGRPANLGGLQTAYLVFTGYTAVKPLAGVTRRVEVALMLMAVVFAVVGYWYGLLAWGAPGHQIGGVPAGMMFFLATIISLAAIGDLRLIIAGGIQGSRRLARHLWRMCFGLFIASGSFFLGQMKFIPAPIRNVPILSVIALSPLVFLLYWMWRVRLKKNLRGLITSTLP